MISDVIIDGRNVQPNSSVTMSAPSRALLWATRVWRTYLPIVVQREVGGLDGTPWTGMGCHVIFCFYSALLHVRITAGPCV